MSVGRWLRDAALVALVGLPLSVPGLHTTSYGGWPALGFATVLFVLEGQQRRWWVFAAVTLVSGAGLTWGYHVSPLLGLAASLAVTLPSLLAATLLARHGPGQQAPLDRVPIVAYHAYVAISGALCGVLGAFAVIPIESPRSVLVTGVMSFLAGMTAQLVLLPLLMRGPRESTTDAGRVELTVQRLLLAVIAYAVFWPTSHLAVGFLLFPLLAWAALRASRFEAHLQLFLLALWAYALTYAGHGPLAGPLRGLSADATPALLYLFVAAACYLTVPVARSVEQLTTVTDQATRAAGTVQLMLDSATGTLFIATDQLGRITHYNSGAERTLGYTFDEVVGKSPAMFHTVDEVVRQAHYFDVPPAHAQVVLAQVRSGERRDWEFRHRDGSIRMTSLSLSEILDPSGSVRGYIATGEDITERLRGQQALEAALAREHASVQRLEEVDHVKQELVSNVSHELRTPITSISGYTELLADGDLGELNEAQGEAVHRIERNTARLGLLVEDLLTLSRAESGQLEFVAEPVDLREVAREAYEMAVELARGRELDMRLDLPDTPLTVHGDAAALERVAVNLLSNAIKFTPDGGRVEISVAPAGHDAALVVRDTGMGIPLEDQQHLFTRFFRASAATEHAIQGTGLGLSIVHAIVTRHGGDVAVDSRPGGGTAVHVRLPRTS